MAVVQGQKQRRNEAKISSYTLVASPTRISLYLEQYFDVSGYLVGTIAEVRYNDRRFGKSDFGYVNVQRTRGLGNKCHAHTHHILANDRICKTSFFFRTGLTGFVRC